MRNAWACLFPRKCQIRKTPREEGARMLGSPGYLGSLCGRETRTRHDKEPEGGSEAAGEVVGLATAGGMPSSIWVPLDSPGSSLRWIQGRHVGRGMDLSFTNPYVITHKCPWHV